MRNLYGYIDENGSHTSGRLFIVAGLIIEAEFIDQITTRCEVAELESRKGKDKWKTARFSYRLAYIDAICAFPELKGSMFYSVFRQTTAYDEVTIAGIAQMVNLYTAGSKDYKASIHVDALSKHKRHQYRTGLSKHGIRVHNVRGIKKEENSTLIRLADAVAGLAMDALDGHGEETAPVFRRAVRCSALTEAR